MSTVPFRGTPVNTVGTLPQAGAVADFVLVATARELHGQAGPGLSTARLAPGDLVGHLRF